MEQQLNQEENIMKGPEGIPTDAKELGPEEQSYVNALMKLLHSKETGDQVAEMLLSGPPEETVPHTALTINEQFESEARAAGKPPSLDTIFVAGTYLVTDLIEIGNAIGAFQLETEEQMQPIVQKTFQAYIQKGLKDGTIDPIELQQKVEPLMNPEDHEGGMKIAQATGVPVEPNEHTAMEVYANKRVKQAGMLKGGKR